LCYGLATESHFDNGFGDYDPLRLKVIAGCESNSHLKQRFEQVNNVDPSHSFSDLKKMMTDVHNQPNLRADLYDADIMSITTPCQGRSVTRELNKIDPSVVFEGEDLFLVS